MTTQDQDLLSEYGRAAAGECIDKLQCETETGSLGRSEPAGVLTEHERPFKIKTCSLDAAGSAVKETRDNRHFEIKTC